SSAIASRQTKATPPARTSRPSPVQQVSGSPAARSWGFLLATLLTLSTAGQPALAWLCRWEGASRLWPTAACREPKALRWWKFRSSSLLATDTAIGYGRTLAIPRLATRAYGSRIAGGNLALRQAAIRASLIGVSARWAAWCG